MKPIDKQIKQFLELIEMKWKNGISKFKDKINSFRDDGKIKIIRTSLYGDIVLNAQECLFIDSFYLQRLREVSHMGFVYYVYPEARHSRFEHSLGVFWMIKKWLESPFLRTQIKKEGQMNLVCAALLHDIGHGPFSHVTESILYYFGIDTILYPRKERESSKYHERKAKSMILKEPLWDALKKVKADPEEVAKMVIGDPRNKFAPFINGPFDVDKLDYYQRDAFFTGIPTGGIDAEFLMRTLRYDKSKGFYFIDKAFSTIIQTFFNREYIYSIVPYNPVVRVVQSMIIVAFVNALLLLEPKTQAEVLSHLDNMDDNDFWVIMDIISSSNIDNSEIKIVRDLLERIRSRDLYKRAFTLSLDECREYDFHGTGNKIFKPHEYYIDDDFLPLKFIKINNEVVIFEISPLPEDKNKRKENIRKDFEKIQIEKSPKGEVTSLLNKLKDERDAIIKGLASFQHQLNKAILLHPTIREGDEAMLQKVRDKLRRAVGGLKEEVIQLLKNKKNI